MYRAMPSLAPWQRNVIALARGITLKASGQMKWSANVNVHGVTPEDSSIYSVNAIDADSESDAAREVANTVAQAMFGAEGVASFINQTAMQGVYMATVGVYVGHGVTRGQDARIVLRVQ
jgi:hypothetical protein